MRILVLDDDMRRHHAFANNLNGHDVVHVDNYDSALAALLKHPRFDVVYLDHDLNDFGLKSYGPADSMYGGIRSLDGRDVARFMATELPKSQWPKKIVVHSWNDTDSVTMVQILKKAGFNVEKEEFHDRICV